MVSQSQHYPLVAWASQLADLVFLAMCSAIACSCPKPVKAMPILPAVEMERVTEPSPRKKRAVPPEVQEFQRYPLDMQKQALTYLKKWQEGVSR